MLPTEVFLSHASSDQAFVERLAETLRQHGVPVWYSKTHIVGARQWHDQIGEALDRCDWFVAVLSPASVESFWVKQELLYAFDENRYRNHIIPLLYQPCDIKKLSWVLKSIQRVDFTGALDDGYKALFRIWGLNHRSVS